jgi:hypothetical protein
MKVTLRYSEIEDPETIDTVTSPETGNIPNPWFRGFLAGGPVIVHSIEIEG